MPCWFTDRELRTTGRRSFLPYQASVSVTNENYHGISLNKLYSFEYLLGSEAGTSSDVSKEHTASIFRCKTWRVEAFMNATRPPLAERFHACAADRQGNVREWKTCFAKMGGSKALRVGEDAVRRVQGSDVQRAWGYSSPPLPVLCSYVPQIKSRLTLSTAHNTDMELLPCKSNLITRAILIQRKEMCLPGCPALIIEAHSQTV